MEARRNLDAKFIETSAAKEAVLYANTAAYLYERLKKDASVSYVAHELSTEDILTLIQEQSGKTPESPLELVRLYVLLVALSIKDDLNAYRSKFEALDLKHVEWAEQLRQMILNEKVPTTFSKIVSTSTKGSTAMNSTTTYSSGIVLIPGRDDR